MELYNQAFEEALDQNYLSEEKWSNYKKEISTTTNCLKEFLKYPQHEIMVPLGSKAFIRGKLIHTNEVIVAHDTNYFSLVSNSQANEIMQSRSQKADIQLKAIEGERNLFQGKLDVQKEDVFSEREIIEEYNEIAEAEWREKHKDSLRRQKQKEAYERHQTPQIDSDVDQLLEKYELLQELAGELNNLSDEFDDETLSKLMNGQMKLPDSKKRIAHDVEDQCMDVKSTYILQKYKKNEDKVSVEPPINEVKIEDGKKKEKKRRVRFSSEEEVKVIAPVNELHQAEEPTIQISFSHSPGKFHPDPRKADDDPLFCHPGEFLNFVQSQITPAPATKSILKTKGGKKKKSVNFNAAPAEDDEFESFLRQQVVMGDVIEHKNESASEKSQEDKSKKVSKFKEMRTKVK